MYVATCSPQTQISGPNTTGQVFPGLQSTGYRAKETSPPKRHSSTRFTFKTRVW